MRNVTKSGILCRSGSCKAEMAGRGRHKIATLSRISASVIPRNNLSKFKQWPEILLFQKRSIGTHVPMEAIPAAKSHATEVAPKTVVARLKDEVVKMRR